MISAAARRSRASRARRKGLDISRESTPVPIALDVNDPNYDSDDSLDERITFVPALDVSYTNGSASRSFAGASTNGAGGAVLSLSDYKVAVTKRINELFVSGDVADFLESLAELRSPALHFEMVRRLLTTAIERHSRECEIASRALAGMADSLLTMDDFAKGFERLFELADDIELDTPQAKDLLARFLARAVADECLPPSFLTDPFIEKLGGVIVQRAKSLLSIRHGASRLSRVWVPAALAVDDDENYVNALKKEIKLLLSEYLLSGDIDEAVLCVRRMDAPHYHHELVKRAVVLALDGKQRERAMMSTLIYELHARGVLSSAQIAIGFKRLADEVEDLELDTPGAARVLRIFFDQAVRDGVIHESDVPALSR